MLGDEVWLAADIPILPKVFGVEVRALCRPVKFFHTDLDTPFLYGLRFVHGDMVMLKQERAFPKLFATKLEAQISSGMSLYAVALIFHFTGSKGSSLNHEKQPQTIIPPPPNVTVGTMHSCK